MSINYKKLLVGEILYIYIPIIFFLFGWTNGIIAVVCTGAIAVGIIKMYKDYVEDKDNNGSVVSISIQILIPIIIYFLFIGYIAGWGRWVEQAGDWLKHNAILKDLMEREWPVYYSNSNEHSMLTYYIGQYLVPAFIGKIFHSYRLAEIMVFVWNELGIMMVFLHMIKMFHITNSMKQFMTALVMTLFCGPLILAQYIKDMVYPQLDSTVGVQHWLSFNDIQLQYSSNFTMLRWVFPQIIVIWMIILIFIEHKKQIQHYVTLMLPGVIFGTLSFVGIIPLAFGSAVLQCMKKNNLKNSIKKIFSVQNIVVFLTFGLVLILYFYGNVLGDKPANIAFQRMFYGPYKGIYFIFCGIMFIPYVICIWKKNIHNELFHISVISLLFIPFFKLGLYNDWGMRCSIPALFVIMLCVIDYLNNNLSLQITGKNLITKISALVLCVLLLIGSYYPIDEIKQVVKKDNIYELAEEQTFGTLENFANRDQHDSTIDVIYNYYSYDIENNIFYKWIARKK